MVQTVTHCKACRGRFRCGFGDSALIHKLPQFWKLLMHLFDFFTFGRRKQEGEQTSVWVINCFNLVLEKLKFIKLVCLTRVNTIRFLDKVVFGRIIISRIINLINSVFDLICFGSLLSPIMRILQKLLSLFQSGLAFLKDLFICLAFDYCTRVGLTEELFLGVQKLDIAGSVRC